MDKSNIRTRGQDFFRGALDMMLAVIPCLRQARCVNDQSGGLTATVLGLSVRVSWSAAGRVSNLGEEGEGGGVGGGGDA